MPAARHDCSINLSYTVDASSGVQPGNFFIHSVVAHI